MLLVFYLFEFFQDKCSVQFHVDFHFGMDIVYYWEKQDNVEIKSEALEKCKFILQFRLLVNISFGTVFIIHSMT